MLECNAQSAMHHAWLHATTHMLFPSPFSSRTFPFFYQAFILSGLFKPFCFEVLVVMIHPLPFVNYMVHVWGLDTYCAYSSDGELTLSPSSLAPLTLLAWSP
jgi:hypothetical protein